MALRYLLHHFGIHWWGEWIGNYSSNYDSHFGKLHYQHYRFCRICGEIQQETG